jgi:hypothetical protein
MQQRRLRPGDVLDDYCPRERRVTDHAIVAMIDDTIQQTRCVVCDAEHEYKEAKVPPQRRKKAPALFTQVLEGLKAPAPPPHVSDAPDEDLDVADALVEVAALVSSDNGNGQLQEHAEPDAVAVATSEPVSVAAAVELTESGPEPEPVTESQPERFEGPIRRQLIRAALPRPEGAIPPSRVIPEFTIRQPMGRANRHGAGGGGGRRRGQQQGQGQATRFGRSAQGQRFTGGGRSGGHGGPGGNRAGGSRRGGKKR